MALTGLDVIWKSDLPDDLKCDFSRGIVESILLYDSSLWTLTKPLESKLVSTYTRIFACCAEHFLETTPNKTASLRTYPTYISLYQSKRETKITGEVKNRLPVACFYGLQSMGIPELNTHRRDFTTSSVTYHMQWMVVMGGKRMRESE